MEPQKTFFNSIRLIAIRKLKVRAASSAVLLFSMLIQATFAQGNSERSKRNSRHNHGQFHDYQVAITGDDHNDGSPLRPLKNIMAAAALAQPGDTITVHGGVYRERISPPRGGRSATARIWYRAAKGEKVVIKGSEIIKNWKQVSAGVWKVELSNIFFGKFNPYNDNIHGDWLERGSWAHTGEVYFNNKALTEAHRLTQLDSVTDKHPLWYSKVDKNHTTIWANFFEIDPNQPNLTVEINVRQAIFYPSKEGINYIGVEGFTMCQAATPWAPPTAEQIGLIGTHWSKGWVIKGNDISFSKCVGITLGKYSDSYDNKAESVQGYTQTIRRAIKHIIPWDRDHIGSHLVSDNRISHCGQAGIAGSLGGAFSTIAGNSIHDISEQRLFWGYEMAGIKLHGAVDVTICHNHIYRTEGGIWLDWMAQGTHVTANFLHDNMTQDFSLEVDHGPVLVDNNLFLSPQQAQVRLSQGVAFVHNLIAWTLWETADVDKRLTPILKPHSTLIAGLQDNPCGDTRFYNNVFLGKTDLTPYDRATLPVTMAGNVFLMDARPSKHELNPVVKAQYDPAIKIENQDGQWFLDINLERSWSDKKKILPISAKLLGVALVPQQAFADIVKNSLAVDLPSKSILSTDYQGLKRSSKTPVAGAFELKKGGRHRIRVW